MKTAGKNLHSTLESMIDLSHLWIAELHERWLLLQKLCHLFFFLIIKVGSINWDNSKIQSIQK